MRAEEVEAWPRRRRYEQALAVLPEDAPDETRRLRLAAPRHASNSATSPASAEINELLKAARVAGDRRRRPCAHGAGRLRAEGRQSHRL